jgi:glycosyltransferase involved in cell wall biosynthesis
MRIALVCGAMRPREDGVADYTARLARRLADEGVEVVVPTGGEPEEMPDLDVRRVTAGWTPRGVRQAASAIRALAPDLVHIQFAPSAYRFHRAIGLLPLLLGTTPLVVTLHEFGSWAWQPRWLPASLLERAGWWERETLQLAPRAGVVLCVGDASAGLVRARLPKADVRVVPIAPNVAVHPVERDRARSELRRQLGAPQDAPVAAFFGFVHPVKGIPYLLDAVASVRRRRPDVRLVIAGGFTSLALPRAEADAYRAEVEAMIASRGLAEVVRLTGWQPEAAISRLLQGADLAVLPFTAGVTAKSGSLLTVLAHGLPAVVTIPPGGSDGTVARGVLPVPIRDSDALAEAIGRLLDQPELAARLAAEAREMVPEDPWGAIARMHCEIYRSCALQPVPAG